MSTFNRRTILKGTAATAAGLTVGSKASKTFAAPAVIQSGPTKIVYWGSFTDQLGEAEKQLCDNFNAAQTDVALEYQYQGTYEETAQKLTAAVAAKQTPDVSLLSDVWWFKFYLNNTLAPLTDMFAAASIDTTDYVDSLFNEGVREGQSYWVPMARSTPLFYFNKELFTGVGLPDGPAKWDDLVAVAQDLVTKDGDTITRAAFAHPNGASYIAWLFQCVIWQYEGAYSDPEFNILINQENGVAAGNFYRDSVQDGWATTPDDVTTDFLNGYTASIMASTGSLGGIKRDATFDFGTCFLPEAATFGCCTGGSGLAILADKSDEQKAAAFQFVSWATAPEQTEWWSQTTGYMPVRKSAVESETMQGFFAENPNFKTAVDQLSKTKAQDSARVFIPNGDQIIGKGLERITVQGEEVQPVFDDVANTLTEEAQPVIEALAALG
ncbi:MAG: ABC transporter substrate-binding protein [Thermomicrobiales bacterium]|nr:MAG: ABC transporter substrate-binding protein [Thermomicrobiales bacterium]